MQFFAKHSWLLHARNSGLVRHESNPFDHLQGGIDRRFCQEQLDCLHVIDFGLASVELGDFADASVRRGKFHLQRLFIVGDDLPP